jgi:hypothetical protein
MGSGSSFSRLSAWVSQVWPSLGSLDIIVRRNDDLFFGVPLFANAGYCIQVVRGEGNHDSLAGGLMDTGSGGESFTDINDIAFVWISDDEKPAGGLAVCLIFLESIGINVLE